MTNNERGPSSRLREIVCRQQVVDAYPQLHYVEEDYLKLDVRLIAASLLEIRIIFGDRAS
jgi:hypothetical protein